MDKIHLFYYFVNISSSSAAGLETLTGHILLLVSKFAHLQWLCVCVFVSMLVPAALLLSSGCRMWAEPVSPLPFATPWWLRPFHTIQCNEYIWLYDQNISFLLIGCRPSLLLAPVWVCQKHWELTCWKRCSREVKGHFTTCACAARWGGGRQHPEPSWSLPHEWSWPARTQRGWGHTKGAGPGALPAAVYSPLRSCQVGNQDPPASHTGRWCPDTGKDWQDWWQSCTLQETSSSSSSSRSLWSSPLLSSSPPSLPSSSLLWSSPLVSSPWALLLPSSHSSSSPS